MWAWKKSLNGGDIEQHYIKVSAPDGAKVIVQNTQRVGPADELFYTPVSIFIIVIVIIIIIVEPTSSKSMPHNIMVGRVITPLWGNRWIPMKVTNLLDKPITLKRNCKLADVSTCLAVEDFEVFQGVSQPEKAEQEGEPDVPSLQTSNSDYNRPGLLT